MIKRSNEIAIQKNVKMMVYGQAGMGKTTFALSAPKPLLLDFDNGVKRVNTAHLDDNVGIVQVSSWQDILNLLNYNKKDLEEFDTIVVDTIGKMIDFIIAYRCNGRNPQIQDWGTINNDFKWFTSSLSQLNKNIVFVAHRDTRKEGESTVYIPALREKNYNNIVTDLDLLGYLEVRMVSKSEPSLLTQQAVTMARIPVSFLVVCRFRLFLMQTDSQPLLITSSLLRFSHVISL